MPELAGAEGLGAERGHLRGQLIAAQADEASSRDSGSGVAGMGSDPSMMPGDIGAPGGRRKEKPGGAYQTTNFSKPSEMIPAAMQYQAKGSSASKSCFLK